MSLKNYIRQGLAGNEPASDVATCALKITGILKQLYVAAKGMSLMEDAVNEVESDVATTVLQILKKLAEFDHDAYADIRWDRPSDKSEPLEARNLWLRCIAEKGPFIALDCLGLLSASTLRLFRQVMRDLATQMDRNEHRNQRLQEMIASLISSDVS